MKNEYVKMLVHPRVIFGYFIILLGVLGWAINVFFELSEPDSLLASLAIICVFFFIYASKAIKRNESEGSRG